MCLCFRTKQRGFIPLPSVEERPESQELHWGGGPLLCRQQWRSPTSPAQGTSFAWVAASLQAFHSVGVLLFNNGPFHVKACNTTYFLVLLSVLVLLLTSDFSFFLVLWIRVFLPHLIVKPLWASSRLKLILQKRLIRLCQQLLDPHQICELNEPSNSFSC